MEYGSIEREIHVDAPPEVVFEVVSRPEHIQEWWPDEADARADAGRRRGDRLRRRGATGAGRARSRSSTPSRRGCSRSAGSTPTGEVPAPRQLAARDVRADRRRATAPLLRMTETGFRERGWEAAVLEAAYQDHVQGWDFFIPRLGGVRRDGWSPRR